MSIWGPKEDVPNSLHEDAAPYAPFSKADKLGKVADWVSDPAKEMKDQRRSHGRFRDPYFAYGAGSSSFFSADDAESSWSFSVVDSFNKSSQQPSSASGYKSSASGGRTTILRAKGRQQPVSANPRVAASASAVASAQAQAQAQSQPRSAQQNRGARTMTIGTATLHNRRGGRQQPWQNDKLKNRKSSIPITAEFEHIQTNNFAELSKLSFDVQEEEVVGEYGSVQMFDRKMDKLTRAEPLRKLEVTEYNVSTSEDPVISELASGSNGGGVKAFATDGIVAQLMCATKSNVPWDIIVTKRDGQIFFDKRENSLIDIPPVDENSKNPPPEVADNKINSAAAVALEASYINLNFESNVILRGEENTVSFGKPNPFSAGDEPESRPLLPKGYIYKEYNLEADESKPKIPFVVRMEIDAAFDKNGQKALCNVYALNEYGGGKPLVWKSKFAGHSGAIIGEEMKNNLNKLSQWTCRALLAGSNAIKIGFVSRVNSKENHNHQIIAVHTQNPVHLAKQLSFNEQQGWGVIKSLIDRFTDLEDGKYVILRDPNTPALSIYKVPTDYEFEETEEHN